MHILRRLFHRRHREQELDAEVRSYLEHLVDAKVAEGFTEQEARRLALQELGGAEQVKEAVRDVRRGSGMEQVWQDLRYAARGLRKAPAFTAVAVCSLALGIGANTAIFSVLDAVILRTLPVRDPQQLVLLQRFDPGRRPGYSFSYPKYVRLRDGEHGLSGLLAWSSQEFDIQIGQQTTRVQANHVSGNYFEVLGVQPALGRALTADDDQPGAPVAAVISHAFWQSQLGGKAEALGQKINVDGIPAVIVGVMPRQFSGLDIGGRSDVFVPAALMSQLRPNFNLLTSNGFNTWKLAGRRRAGYTPEQVAASLRVLWPRVLADLGQSGNREQIDIAPGATGLSYVRQEYGRALWVLLAVVGVVLLIACVNVANLVLARSVARRHEFGLRLAIGAGRSRLLRQVFLESVLLAALASIAGITLAHFSSRSLVLLMSTTGNSVSLDVGLDLRVLVFTAAIALLTAILFGLAPAWHATRLSPGESLQAAARSSGDRRQSWASRILVSAQLGLSLLLVVGAGLFLRSLHNLRTVDAGFDREHVQVFNFRWGRTRLEGKDLLSAVRASLDNVSGLPGVRAAAFANYTPMGLGSWTNSAQVEGEAARPYRDAECYLNKVSPDFFAAHGTPLVMGRSFNPRDDVSAPKIAIVNEAFVRTFFPAGNPLGRRIFFTGAEKDPFEIVGVAKDVKYSSLRAAAPRQVYFPLFQPAPAPPGGLTLVVRTTGRVSNALLPAIRDGLGTLNKYAAVTATTMDARVDDVTQRERLVAILSSVFGGLALALAMVGLYGLMAYTVTRRTKEIGIRMALGAESRQVLWLVLRNSLLLVGFGTAIGLLAATAVTRLLTGLLFGVSPNDPLALTGAIAILIAVAVLAALIPARRAARVNPTIALRYE